MRARKLFCNNCGLSFCFAACPVSALSQSQMQHWDVISTSWVCSEPNETCQTGWAFGKPSVRRALIHPLPWSCENPRWHHRARGLVTSFFLLSTLRIFLNSNTAGESINLVHNYLVWAISPKVNKSSLFPLTRSTWWTNNQITGSVVSHLGQSKLFSNLYFKFLFRKRNQLKLAGRGNNTPFFCSEWFNNLTASFCFRLCRITCLYLKLLTNQSIFVLPLP